MSSGTIVVSGKLTYDAGWPAPAEFKGERGTITIQVATGKTIAYPVLITDHGHSLDHTKGQDTSDIMLTALITGEPTYTGWTGSQPAAATPSRSDLQLWNGSSITYDENGLATSAVRVIDWWSASVADTDAAELTKLQAILTAAASSVPVSGLKVRPSPIVRDAPDGGTVTVYFGLTSTKDDVEMPGTVYEVDSVHSDTGYIFGKVSIRKVQDDATISWPNTPSQPADLKQGTVGKVQLNDGKWALTYSFVRNTTENQIELDGTWTNSDPNDVGETAKITIVTNSSTPPDDPGAPVGELVGSSTKPLTVASGSYTGYWVHTFDYGATTRLQAIEFEGSDYVVDANSTTRGITNSQTIRTVNDSSTPPSEPTGSKLDSNLKLVRRVTRRFQGTPAQWLHVWEYGRNTSEDNLEHTRRNIDTDDIGESEVVPVLHTSPTSPPTTPTPDTNTTTVVDLTVARVCVANSSFTGLWLWTYTFGPSTRKQRIENDSYVIYDEDNGLGDRGYVVQVVDEVAVQSTPACVDAAGYQLKDIDYKITKIQNDPALWVHAWTFAHNNSKDEIELGGTAETQNEGDNVGETATVTRVNSSATPPSTPSAPIGKHIATITQQIRASNGSYTGRWQHKFIYGHNTPLDELEIRGDFTSDASGNGLGDTDTQVDVTDSDTPPSAPATRITDLKHVRTVSRKIQDTPARWEHQFVFGRNNAEDEIELGGTVTEINTDDLFEEATITRVTNSATPPSDPGTPNSAVLDDIRTKQLTIDNVSYAGRWAHTFIYRPNTRKQAIENSGSRAGGDSLGDRIVTAEVVSTTDSAETYYNSNIAAARAASAEFEELEVVKLTPGKALVRTTEIVATKIVRMNIDTQTFTRPGRGSTVNVVDWMNSDGTIYYGRVAPVVLEGQVGEIIVEMRITADSLSDALTGLPAYNRVNNATFLGFSSSTVQFAGIVTEFNPDLDTADRTFTIRARLRVNTWGFVDQSQVGQGWFPTTTALSGAGYQNASIFGWTVTAPTTADFSVFL